MDGKVDRPYLLGLYTHTHTHQSAEHRCSLLTVAPVRAAQPLHHTQAHTHPRAHQFCSDAGREAALIIIQRQNKFDKRPLPPSSPLFPFLSLFSPSFIHHSVVLSYTVSRSGGSSHELHSTTSIFEIKKKKNCL